MSIQVVGQLMTFNFYGYLTLFDHVEKNKAGNTSSQAMGVAHSRVFPSIRD